MGDSDGSGTDATGLIETWNNKMTPMANNDTVKNTLIYYALTFLTFLAAGCGTGNTKGSQTGTAPSSVQPVSLQQDTVRLQEPFNEEDMLTGEYLTDKLQPVRDNFKRINAIRNWTAIDTVALSESTEGGEARYYYRNGQLEKIVARYYGETFRLLAAYYLLDGQLSFVFEKRHQYNRPLYYDTIAMQENNDTEAFDFNQSAIIEDRSYFENGQLLHQVNNQDCGSPFSDDYLQEEQQRIRADFDKLIEKHKRQDR